jgi:EmrB/QacA subfamily drug resistance transporter
MRMLNVKHPCDEGVVLAARPPEPHAEAARPWVLPATILGSSLAFIDGTVVNVALPALQRDLGATVADVQWVVEAYALLLSALLLVGGSLGDRLGRRRVYAIGVCVFAAASALCGLAPTIGQLVVARAVQGAGAALVVPGSLAIISASFGARERGRAIAIWSSFSALTSAAGPVFGGWLIEHLSWRWAFCTNVPLGAAVLALLRHVPESRDPDATGPLDWPGAVLVTIGLGGMVYGLVESARIDARAWHVWGGLAGGTAALVAFVRVEGRSTSPMVPPSLFRSRTFTGANVLTFFLYGALGSTLFFLPLNLIQVQRYSATAAGAASLPFVTILFLLSRWSADLVDRFGAKVPLVVGPTITAAGYVLLARQGIGGSYWTTFFPPLVTLGFGMAVSVAPLTTTVMSAVDAHHAGVASGINNAVSRTAGLMAVALMGVLVVHVFDRELDRRLATATLAPDVVAALKIERVKLAGAEPSPDATAGERDAVRRAVAEAFVAGFRSMAVVAAALALAAAGTAALMIGGAPSRGARAA